MSVHCVTNVLATPEADSYMNDLHTAIPCTYCRYMFFRQNIVICVFSLLFIITLDLNSTKMLHFGLTMPINAVLSFFGDLTPKIGNNINAAPSGSQKSSACSLYDY